LIAAFVLGCGSSCALTAEPTPGGNRPSGYVPSVQLVPPATGVESSGTAPAALPSQSGGAVPSLVPSTVPSAAPRRFVVLGDSLSAWAFAPGSASPSTGGAWPEMLATEDPALILVNNAGVPGNTTAQMLARLQSDVLAFTPDLLFVLGGTNDIGYDVPASAVIANITQIVETAKARGIDVVLLTIPPANGQTELRRQARRDINADLATLAADEGILLVDVFSTLASPDENLADGYAAIDGLHLSIRGEQALADAVYRALKSE